MSITGTVIAESILYLRVYALMGQGRWRAAFLATMFLGVHGALYVAHARFLISLKYVPSPFPNITSCLPVQAESRMLSIVFILILCSEMVITVITISIGVTKYRQSNSPLLSTFYRDGLFYFVLLGAGNIICNLTAPLGYMYLFAIPQRVFHSILSTRMILQIRMHSGGAYGTDGRPLSDLDSTRIAAEQWQVRNATHTMST
ncbi:hypothetical protein DFP72DRAFT_1058478 [Ephemerocybe angulata]|uniref:Uncharacterized protein n=1 Tax=Ephemerocybe angulata TaxID=980116 RepID=A0A8H6IHY7_9AGAR|nr:hypothetical protein DFP72DRAFT_1058478 [Tulosesus angulatus]